jgi:hypothetical protein
METVNDKAVDQYAKRLERQMLKQYGCSLTFGTIARASNPFVIEIRPDQKIMIMREGWREAMQAKADWIKTTFKPQEKKQC